MSLHPTVQAINAGFSDKPVVIIDVTGRCNLKCVHCWNAAYSPHELSEKSILTLINATPINARIHFLGGEPLLHPNIVPLVAVAAHRGHYTSMVTNGTLVTDELINQLIDAGLSEIAVSLDGPDSFINDRIRGHGTFDRAFDALCRIARIAHDQHTHLTVSVSATVNRLNAERISDLPLVLHKSGLFIDNLILDRVVPEGRAAQYESQFSLSPSPQQLLEAADRVCSSWKNFPRLYSLTIKVPPLIHEYLSLKHFIFLRDSIIGCPALQSQGGARICSSGAVYSCSREALIRQAQSHGYLPLQGLTLSELEALGENPWHLSDFHNTLRPLLLPRTEACCNDCRWAEYCVECPLVKLIGSDESLGDYAHGSSSLCKLFFADQKHFSVPTQNNGVTESSVADFSISENDVIRFSPGVYHKVLKNGSVEAISVLLDKSVIFPREFRADILFEELSTLSDSHSVSMGYTEKSGELPDIALYIILKLIEQKFLTIEKKR